MILVEEKSVKRTRLFSLHKIYKMENFDLQTTPLITLLDKLLTEYDASLRNLLKLLDTEGNRNTTPEATQQRVAASQRLVKLDHQLQQLYGGLEQHQQRQAQIRNRQLLSIKRDKTKHHFVARLLDAKSELEEMICQTDKTLEQAKVSQAADPPVSEIIEYAKKLSKFTTAPPNYDPNNANGGVPPEPPYPVLVAMRAGMLNRYRNKKVTQKDDDKQADMEDGDFAGNMDDEEFDEIDADNLLLSLDLNPDL